MNTLAKLVAAASLALSAAAWMPAHAAAAVAESSPAAQAGASMAQGEVRKIDKDAGKLTIRHGELKNLDMPPMTMVFRVKDPAMLEQLQVGDKISFSADKIGGQFTVTQIEINK